jgi:hypothetical protein
MSAELNQPVTELLRAAQAGDATDNILESINLPPLSLPIV